MSFPKYPKYKDSGVEWLGEVPEHWGVEPGRRSFSQEREPGREEDVQLSATQRYGVVPQALFMELEDQKVVLALGGLGGFKHVEAGDFVISLRSFQGGIERSEYTGCVSPAYTVLRPQRPVAGRYWAHLLKSGGFVAALQSMTDGIREGKSISYQQFGQVLTPVPPLSEQEATASFLDRETAKIDELVAEQQRLLELLMEKRQTVISRAVTKGLNPGAPMKASGVEWLGEVPIHWEVGPVKRFFTSYNPRRVPLSTEERSHRTGDYPYYGASGIIDHVDDFIFDEGLVLVSEDGANLLNRSTPIAFVARGRYWVNNHAHILKPVDNNLEFWAERLESIALTPFLTGSAQPKLTSEALLNLQIAVPPDEHERAAIQDAIVVESEAISELSREAKQAIELLQERRSALISAAVTGKFDVRHLAWGAT